MGFGEKRPQGPREGFGGRSGAMGGGTWPPAKVIPLVSDQPRVFGPFSGVFGHFDSSPAYWKPWGSQVLPSSVHEGIILFRLPLW